MTTPDYDRDLARQVLDLPMQEEGFPTIRAYLIGLLSKLWQHGEGFSGKRPFGNSGWNWDLYEPLIKAGLVTASYYEDGDIKDIDGDTANQLIAEAIRELGAAR